ncbi:hypothetical protein N7537_010625 [Penicillium hordei]|uniref:Uncharacterized protein n=1 Tax=Penicillium hordei TaxID=40994 RepID=A0AAD6DVC1_9EURO|nr:uncharacterized protein N7537_010625 [Penicillium hordei]KAJ5593721.1 hypothetical protein N7537_010625 [Penicillium hordei]
MIIKMLCASFLAMVVLEASRVLAETTIPPSVQGYYWDSVSWSEVPCYDGQTYFSWNRYGRCCTSSTDAGCTLPTACHDNSVYFIGVGGLGTVTKPFSCATDSTCVAMTIYESATTNTPVVDYFCYQKEHPWTASTIFRTTELATATPRTSVTPSTATPTSSGDAAQDSESSGSKAWIAGAVVGPVAACAIIASLASWLMRRSRARRQETVSGNEDIPSPPNMTTNTRGAKFGPPSELADGPRKPIELDGVNPISELPAQVHPAIEPH